ncbi:hypothetical protein [Azospirillum sp. TSO35-2]|uniref:hypothetical protein n=1 Tax=Azospirillum sp. TSO35-2 TaxID=716796 RepID=UPI000D606105|nr:hypothetical protein [Azospirillum sp. TSO35-2]PWC34030.1 hypothetical protein TSO352_27255 [Azospirillum sp. TSO35-2]
MRACFPVVALAATAFLALSSPVLAQSQGGGQGSGWGGALDQLNRAVNPNNYPDDRTGTQTGRARDDRSRDDRRYEGSSASGRGNAYSDYSDRDLRNQYDRLADEQRRVRQDRQAVEDEMERRGLRR